MWITAVRLFLPYILYFQRTPSTTSDESQFPGSSQSLELDPQELSSSSSSSLPRPQPQRSKPKGKSLNPFTSSSANPNVKGSEANSQISKSLLQLAKNRNKEGKEKKKKKGKGGSAQTAGREWGTGKSGWIHISFHYSVSYSEWVSGLELSVSVKDSSD